MVMVIYYGVAERESDIILITELCLSENETVGIRLRDTSLCETPAL